MDQNHPNTQPGYYTNADKQSADHGTSFPTSNHQQSVQNPSLSTASTNVNQQVANNLPKPMQQESTDWVRFNTICNKDLVNKVRAIADISHCCIRDVVELMFRRGIKA